MLVLFFFNFLICQAFPKKITPFFFFLNFAPPNFFFPIWPSQVGDAGSAPALGKVLAATSAADLGR
jgi:hypothetical protein